MGKKRVEKEKSSSLPILAPKSPSCSQCVLQKARARNPWFLCCGSGLFGSELRVLGLQTKLKQSPQAI
jgi:hypothetical protein